jgi:hypothetical protein
MNETDDIYLLIAASPYLFFRLVILTSVSEGFQSRFSALIKNTSALVASIFIGFVWCEEKRVF